MGRAGDLLADEAGADQALRAGDLGRYQQEIKRIRDLLEQMSKLSGGGPPPR